jgi:glycerate kinase
MGAALVGLLGAELKPGIRIVIEALNLAEAVADADLVITGEGRIDSQTIHGKTPIGVARCAKQFGKPVIGIAGCLTDDCGVVHEHGLDAVFAVVNRAMSCRRRWPPPPPTCSSRLATWRLSTCCANDPLLADAVHRPALPRAAE